MAESKEVRTEAVRKPLPEPTLAPGPAVTLHPNHEAMSWIRALANDWEDERSHSEATK